MGVCLSISLASEGGQKPQMVSNLAHSFQHY